MIEHTDTTWRQNLGKDIVLVFSCPGKKEMECGRPISGPTGTNFAYIWSKLKYHDQTLSSQDVSITNAWPNIEYNNLTGRSEAENNEILNTENLERLKEEIGSARIVFVFGQKAKLAVSTINIDDRFIMIEATHPSPLNVNTHIKSNPDGTSISGETPEERNHARLDRIVQEIIEKSNSLLSHS